jgi:hypothetical protein
MRMLLLLLLLLCRRDDVGPELVLVRVLAPVCLRESLCRCLLLGRECRGAELGKRGGTVGVFLRGRGRGLLGGRLGGGEGRWRSLPM